MIFLFCKANCTGEGYYLVNFWMCPWVFLCAHFLFPWPEDVVGERGSEMVGARILYRTHTPPPYHPPSSEAHLGLFGGGGKSQNKNFDDLISNI